MMVLQDSDALLLIPHPSKRRQGFALFVSHRYGHDLSDDNFYVDDESNVNVHSNYQGEMGQHHPAGRKNQQNQPLDAFVANDYESGSTHRNKVIGKLGDNDNRRNNSHQGQGIMDVLSQVFNPSTNNHPSSAKRPISLPDIQDLFPNENVQKILTSNAILSGGKIVSSLVGEVILHTAKFAMNTLGNNNHTNTLSEESLTSSHYSDVCEFDNELCQEIQDALAATESFKVLTEKSKTENYQHVFDFEEQNVGNSKDPVQHHDISTSFDAITSDRSHDFTNTRTQHLNRVDNKSTDGHTHFASSTQESSKYQEYYQRSLEEQLAQHQKSKMSPSKRGISEVVSREPSSRQSNERYYAKKPIIQMKQPDIIDTRALLDKNRREMVSKHSKWRDGQPYWNGHETIKHPTQHTQTRNVEPAEVKMPQIPKQPSLKHYESYVKSTAATQSDSKVDTVKDHDGISNVSEHSKWSEDHSYAERSVTTNNIPRERLDSLHKENSKNDANATPRFNQKHMSSFANGDSSTVNNNPRERFGFTNDVNSKPRFNQRHKSSFANVGHASGVNSSPVKLDITDEALAFARSLNLDVYGIYLSMQTTGSNRVVTLENVVQYCERMRIGPWRYQFDTADETRTSAQPTVSRRETILERPNVKPIAGGERRRNVDNFERRHLEQTQSADRARMEPRANERVPRFKPRNYDQQSKVHNKTTQGTDYRPPRFKKYPAARRASHSLPPPAYINTRNPDSNKFHYTSNENRFSMSQLIASQPERKTEYRNVRDSRQKSRLSTVSLAKLIQGPRERGMEQVPTNTFREPYQEGRESKSRTAKSELTDTLKKPYPRQPSLRELSERYAPLVTDTTQEFDPYDNPNPELS